MPPLREAELTLALQQLQALQIGAAEKNAIADMLRAAANPDAEQVDVVIASLEQQRQANIGATVKELAAVSQAVTGRARAGLWGMSDAEWDRLVQRANDE